MESYLNFTLVNESSLNGLFQKDLLQTQDMQCMTLHQIINKYNNKIKLGFFNSTVDGIECFIVMISSKSDELLIKLANQYNLPRGFPILWIPEKSITMYGFYPKFENDKLQKNSEQDVFNPSEFIDAQEIKFTYKYSGFLSSIIAFQLNGKNYWTSCSKNSTDNLYSKNASLIVKDHMTSELLSKMCDDGIYFCGEVMAFFDQVHGAAVKKECMIVTLVGYNHKVSIDMEQVQIATEVEIQNLMERTKFLNIFDQNSMHTFCLEYNLPVDTIFKISSSEEIHKFMRDLTELRNYLDLSSFKHLCASCPSLTLKCGNIDHFDILGDILEGCIIHVINTTIPNKTIKYKLPKYTCRTMLLREHLSKNNHQLNGNFITEIDDFVKRWVVDLSDSRMYWTFILYTLYNEFNKLHLLYETYTSTIEDKTMLVGEHIFIVDELFKLPVCTYNPSNNYYQMVNEFGYTLSEKKDNISSIYALGPIGIGKSTVGKMINSIDNLHFKHIDGDILDLESIEVLNLKEERNPYTSFKQSEAITQNLIPVLSFGGGQMLGNNKIDNNIEMFKQLRSSFGGVELASIFFLPFKYREGEEYISLEGTSLSELIEDCVQFNISKLITEDSLLARIKEIYDDEVRFDEMFANRVEKDSWKTSDRDRLFGINKQNFEVMTKIIQYGSFDNQIRKIILYPSISVSNYGQDMSRLYESFKTFAESKIKMELSHNNMNYLSAPVFNQKRLLVQYGEKFHHITLKCDFKNAFTADSIHDHLQLQNVEGYMYYCPKKDVVNHLFDSLGELDIVYRTLIHCDYSTDSKGSQNHKILVDLIDSTIQQIQQIRESNNFSRDIDLIAKIHDDLNKIQQKLGAFKQFVPFDKELIKSKINKKEKWYVSVILFETNGSIFEDELQTCAHITVDSGIHEAYKMRDVALNINSGIYEFELSIFDKKTKSALSVEYISSGYYPIPVKLGRVFYI